MFKSQNVTLSSLFLISLLIFSCGGYTTEEIESESKGTVIESISKSLDISSSNIKVEDYTLVQKSDNVYTGILKTEYQDMTQTFDIEVVWDHSTDEYTAEWELKEEKEKSITPNVENNKQSQNQVTDELDPDDNFYIIAVSIASSDIEAMDKVKSLESQGYNSDFLWIPDYKSLSGAKYFSVYIGPFRSESECALAIEDYRKINPSAYGLLVSNESPKRVEIRGPNKIKISDGSDIKKSSGIASLNGTKKCLINYDWVYPDMSNLISAWKFSSDGSFNSSTTMFGGMSSWGNWEIISPGKIKITYTRTTEGIIPENQTLIMQSCDLLKVGSTVYKKY
jgi:hypothetical protein